MQLFSYLYIAVVVIPCKLIKVMKSKVFLLYLTQAIPSKCHITGLLETDMITIPDFTLTIPGTGTTGDTINILGSSTMVAGTTLIGVGLIAIILAHLLDRWLNRKQGLESMDREEELTNQDNRE